MWTRDGGLYLAVVINLFARRVVGWATADRLHPDLALATLRKALTMRRPAAGLIHHSDRGSQYCSIDYQAELRKHGILISMCSKGNCYDNAMVETFLKTLKSELVWRTIFYPRQEADRHWPLHRRVLQSRPAPFRSRLHKPAVGKNGRRMTQCLSTKTGQVHSGLSDLLAGSTAAGASLGDSARWPSRLTRLGNLERSGSTSST